MQLWLFQNKNWFRCEQRKRLQHLWLQNRVWFYRTSWRYQHVWKRSWIYWAWQWEQKHQNYGLHPSSVTYSWTCDRSNVHNNRNCPRCAKSKLSIFSSDAKYMQICRTEIKIKMLLQGQRLINLGSYSVTSRDCVKPLSQLVQVSFPFIGLLVSLCLG